MCVCVCEGGKKKEGEWAGGTKKNECDNTTKWDQEGILSCSCVPIAPLGNGCFISVTKATLLKPHSENKVLLLLLVMSRWWIIDGGGVWIIYEPCIDSG